MSPCAVRARPPYPSMSRRLQGRQTGGIVATASHGGHDREVLGQEQSYAVPSVGVMTTTTPEDIHPFRIDIAQADIDQLHRRIDETRWPTTLPGGEWDTGVAVSWLRELVQYWRDSYDWRAAERELNQIPQFTTEIDGQRIHFLHVRSPETGCTTTDPHSWLAWLGGGVPRRDWPLDRSRSARR